jgi:hypothetical protein
MLIIAIDIRLRLVTWAYGQTIKSMAKNMKEKLAN